MIQILKNQKTLKIKGKQFKDNISNYRLLSERELLLEGPITRHYNWPSKYDSPMNHQVVTADFVTRHRRGFIFNSIGTGKTLIIDWLIDFLQKEKEIHRAIIVAPLSTLQSVHADELRWSLPHLSYGILHGSKQKRLKELAKDKDVYIINFDGLKVLEEVLLKRTDIDCVFIDEVAILRNKNNALWETANRLFGAHTNKMVWGLTGSPMPKAPTDCYGQARLIRPDNLPQQINWRHKNKEPIPFYKFKYLTMDQWSEYTWEPKKGWEDICYKILQPSIRFTLAQCADIPELATTFRDIALTNEQKKVYKQMTKKMKMEINNKHISAVNEGALLTKLLQITSGAVYDADKNTHLIDSKNKMKDLLQVIDESSPGHILIFAPFRNILKHITRTLCKEYGEGLAEYIDSDVTPKKRTEYYRRFTIGNLRFIVAIPSCMSHGLNLQAKCSVAVWWSPIVRYDIYEQACGRIYRNGQKEKTLIVHLQSAPIERKIYKKLHSKANAQNILLDLLKEKL